jgi:hypothetical protein
VLPRRGFQGFSLREDCDAELAHDGGRVVGWIAGDEGFIPAGDGHQFDVGLDAGGTRGNEQADSFVAPGDPAGAGCREVAEDLGRVLGKFPCVQRCRGHGKRCPTFVGQLQPADGLFEFRASGKAVLYL